MFDEAFAAMNREPRTPFAVSDALTTLNRNRVFDYAAVRNYRRFRVHFHVRSGGLMSVWRGI